MKDSTRKVLEDVLEQKKAAFVYLLNDIKADIEKTIVATSGRWLISEPRTASIGERAAKLPDMLREIRDIRADLRERDPKAEATASGASDSEASPVVRDDQNVEVDLKDDLKENIEDAGSVDIQPAK